MCTNQRYIYNKHLKRSVYVKCGKCDACKQEKADMLTNKIRRQAKDGYIMMFIHLTYSNDCVPYIRKSEIKYKQVNNHKAYYINIYRDSVNYRAKLSKYVSDKKRLLFKTHVVDKKYIPRCDSLFDVTGLKSMTNNNDPDKVSVIYYKDFQDFFKRLKEYVKYHFPNTLGKENIKFFVVSEYGEDNSRAHFHLLLQVKQKNFEEWRSSVAANWLFDSYDLTYNNIEVATHAETYCASYVNCDTIICPFLRKNFPIVRRHSLFFGRENKAFTLPSILEKINARDMRYDCLCRVGHESYSVKPVLIPRYVTDYWFPHFKGFSKLSYQEVIELLQYPQTIYKYAGKLGLLDRNFDRKKCKLVTLESKIHKLLTLINTCISRYYEDSSLIFEDSFTLRAAYALDYVRFNQSKNSTLWRLHYEQVNKNSLESYINLDDRNIHHPILVDKALYNLYLFRCGCDLATFDPNNFSSVVTKSQLATVKYNNYIKKHKYYGAKQSLR